MKKRLLSAISVAFVTIGMQAAVGDDLTGKYLQNADFSADQTVQGRICTYDYDMAGGTYTMFGQQAVTGWTSANPSDNVQVMENSGSPAREDGANARAAGVCGINELNEEGNYAAELGGAYYAPEYSYTGASEGTALGMVAVWSSTIQYTQAVTFPAGAYTIKIPVWNAGGTGAVAANLCGFIADNGTKYTVERTSWVTEGTAEWFIDEVTFLLEEETTGVISLGYQSANAGSGSMPHLFLECVKILEADYAAIIKERVDALKEEGLLPLLEAGDELGVSTKAGWAVYSNDAATLEEVQKAIENQKAINEAGMTDFTDFFISNAHFAQGTPMDNGVCTYDYDMEKNETTYYGMQPIPNWTASDPSTNTVDGVNNGRASGLFAVGSDETVWLGSKGDVTPATKASGATEGNLFGFISVWSAKSSYTQSVTLPAGSYTITIPTYNERGTGAVAKNLCGFIADDGTEYLAETTVFPEKKWSDETIKFTLDEETSGVISIGYTAANAGSGSMPHLFVDEFLLKYNGQTDMDPSLIALTGAIRSGEAYVYAEEPYDAAIRSALEEAIDVATELKDANSSDSEANTAAATSISSLISDARASQGKYAQFAAFIDGTLSQTIDAYTEGDLESFAEGLADTRDEYIEAYNEGSYTNAKIDEIMAGFNDVVVAAVTEALAAATADGKEHHIDITCLYADKNLKYANSNVDGWKNETGTTAFLSRVQTAEVWNQASFNVYQVLENMPAGVYEISAPGFYRSAANVDNAVEYENNEVVGSAYMYANGNRVLMHNVMEYAAAQDENHTAEAGSAYVPNSNDNAHYIFYVDGEAVNTVTAALPAEGDLTIGVKGENLEGNAWVVWGGFSVVYKGTANMNAPLYEQMMALSEQAVELGAEVGPMVAEADNKVLAATGKAETLSADSEIDALVAAIAQLEEAIAYANNAQKAYDEMQSLYNVYSESLLPSVDSDDESLSNLLDMISGGLDEGFESIAAIDGYKAELPKAWTRFVQYNALAAGDASENNPYDITAAILNASFEGDVTNNEQHGEFWAASNDGGNYGYQFGIYENYNSNTFDIHQTIEGLAKGYYEVKVQGFYRAGSNQANADAIMGDSLQSQVIFYANEWTKPLSNQLENGSNGELVGVGSEPVITFGENAEYYVPNNREALEAQFGMDLYWNTLQCYVGEDGVLTIGLKKETHVEADWTPFDNFQLFYLGTATPDAIQGVEADATIKTNAIYDITGRKVAKMQKGLYIANGRKYLVK